MKATDANLLSFLNSAPQLVIPIYQRTCSWTEKECRQLWEDILRARRSAHLPVHFLGSVVYTEESRSDPSSRAPLLVIDGQQHPTPVTLLLAAVSRVSGSEEPVDGSSAEKIRNRSLLDPEKDGDPQFKLLLSKTGKATLDAVVKSEELPEQYSRRVKETFEYFSEWLENGSDVLGDICFPRDEGFDIHAHAARAFSSYQHAAGLSEVIWHFAPEAAERAAEWRFHPDQQTRPLPDGGLEVRFRASGHLEMAWHLYQWGDSVTVMAPEALATLVHPGRREDFDALP